MAPPAAVVVVPVVVVVVADVVVNAMKVGLGVRQPIIRWLNTHPAHIEVLEITAEHFFHFRPRWLYQLSQHYPILIHCISLSLGTPGKLNQEKLSYVKALCDWLKPKYLSEHVAFTETSTRNMGHLCPIPYNKHFLNIVSEHAKALADACQTPLLLENITTHLTFDNPYTEPEFLNRLTQRADCGLLLDLTNLYINSQNHQECPYDWLTALDCDKVRQIHLVGYQRTRDGLEDTHGQPIQSDLSAFIRTALDFISPEYCILERDKNIPNPKILGNELNHIRQLAHHEEVLEPNEETTVI